jgi:hypothetical protein
VIGRWRIRLSPGTLSGGIGARVCTWRSGAGSGIRSARCATSLRIEWRVCGSRRPVSSRHAAQVAGGQMGAGLRGDCGPHAEGPGAAGQGLPVQRGGRDCYGSCDLAPAGTADVVGGSLAGGNDVHHNDGAIVRSVRVDGRRFTLERDAPQVRLIYSGSSTTTSCHRISVCRTTAIRVTRMRPIMSKPSSRI